MQVRPQHRRHGGQRTAERGALVYRPCSNGGQVDPFSGVPMTPGELPARRDAAETAQLNAAVAARRYTGVQDYSDWPGEPADRYDDFWDPDQAPPTGSSPYAAWPRYPGLMDRAQQAFTAEGLDVPWYTARGNHDTIWQGTFLPPAAIKLLVTSCFKIFPNDKFDPTRYQAADHGAATSCRTSRTRRSSSAARGGADRAAGSGPPLPVRRRVQEAPPGRRRRPRLRVSSRARQKQKSNGAAEYYAFTRNGIRFIAIDTNAEGGSASGNVDDPQYHWIEKQLKKAAAEEPARDRPTRTIRCAARRRRSRTRPPGLRSPIRTRSATSIRVTARRSTADSRARSR